MTRSYILYISFSAMSTSHCLQNSEVAVEMATTWGHVCYSGGMQTQMTQGAFLLSVNCALNHIIRLITLVLATSDPLTKAIPMMLYFCLINRFHRHRTAANTTTTVSTTDLR